MSAFRDWSVTTLPKIIASINARIGPSRRPLQRSAPYTHKPADQGPLSSTTRKHLLILSVTRFGGVEERRGCLGHAATLRFLSPLIEPDMQISSIRLSDKTSRLRPRFVVAKPAQTYEPEVPVQVREWIGPALASPDFVLEPQPPA
jgi:hypothetical protein